MTEKKEQERIEIAVKFSQPRCGCDEEIVCRVCGFCQFDCFCDFSSDDSESETEEQ